MPDPSPRVGEAGAYSRYSGECFCEQYRRPVARRGVTRENPGYVAVYSPTSGTSHPDIYRYHPSHLCFRPYDPRRSGDDYGGRTWYFPERHAQLLAEMGLDKPLWQQYAHYIWGVLHGDLGISLKSRIPVWQEFVPRFKATLELGVCAMIFAVAVGIPVGVLAAVKRGSIFDHTAVGLALTGYSMPIFWWGMMLIMLVSVQLNLTPVSGRISDTVFLDDTLPLTGFMLIDTAIWGEQGDFIDALMHMILPAIVLGTIPLAVIVRMTRSSMLEVLGEDYIRTARAKGLTRMRVIVIHALRNAMLPVVTVIGLQVGTLLAGAILTETIFSWPRFRSLADRRAAASRLSGGAGRGAAGGDDDYPRQPAGRPAVRRGEPAYPA